jgi:hypothetical protein
LYTGAREREKEREANELVINQQSNGSILHTLGRVEILTVAEVVIPVLAFVRACLLALGGLAIHFLHAVVGWSK